MIDYLRGFTQNKIYFLLCFFLLGQPNVRSEEDAKKTINIEDLMISKNIYRLIVFPSVSYLGPSYNFVDIAQSTDPMDALVYTLINQFLLRNIMNLVWSFSISEFNSKDSDLNYEQVMQQRKELQRTANLFAIFFENFLFNSNNFSKFLNWADEVIKKFNSKNEKLIIYSSIIMDDLEEMNKIFTELKNIDKKEMLENTFKEKMAQHSIFYPIFSLVRQDYPFFKITFPSRINYKLIKSLVNKNKIGLQRPYRFAGRWVLTNIIEQREIQNISIKDFLSQVLNIKNIKDKNLVEKIKKKLQRQLFEKNRELFDLLILFYFAELSKASNNTELYNKIEQYFFWKFCDLTSSHYLDDYRKQDSEKSRQKN